MKSIKRLVWAVAAIVALAGCAKEIETPEPGRGEVREIMLEATVPGGAAGQNQAPAGTKTTSQAGTGQGQTKTTTGETIGTVTQVVWTPGDRIAVYDGQAVREFTTDLEAPAKTAMFKGDASSSATYSAIYPYDAVGEMGMTSLITTYEITIPALQDAVAGSFDPKAHVAYAITGKDKTMHFHHAVAMLKITVPEGTWQSVTFRGGAGEAIAGSAQLYVPYLDSNDDAALAGSARLTDLTETKVSLTGIKAGGTYMIAIAPTEFKQGFSLTFAGAGTSTAEAKTTKAASVAAGQILDLGVPPIEAAPDYTITGTSELSSFSSALTQYGITGTSAMFANMIANSYLKDTDKPVTMVNFTYNSLDPFGLPETFSARLYVLKSTWQSGATLSKLVLANHGTIMMDGEAPTSKLDAHGLLAWGPTAVVVPDYYGFGSTYKSGFQAYLHRESIARECLDALVAARKLLADKKITTTGASYFNVGYSQGGHTCIANLRYLVEHPGEYDFKLTSTYAGAGPYDIPATYTWMMAQTSCNGTFSIPISVISMNLYERLGIDYAKVFKEPLLSKYPQWVLSRNYSTSALTYYLGTDPKAILTDGVLDMSSEEAVKLQMCFEKNSLVSGWTPDKDCKVTLMHSTTDDIVPELNTEHMYTYLKNAGVNVTLNKGDFGSHMNAAMNYAMAMIQYVYY